MEWLATLGVQWVLITIGILVLVRSALRRCSGHAAALREFVDAGLVAVVAVFLIIRPFIAQA